MDKHLAAGNSPAELKTSGGRSDEKLFSRRSF